MRSCLFISMILVLRFRICTSVFHQIPLDQAQGHQQGKFDIDIVQLLLGLLFTAMDDQILQLSRIMRQRPRSKLVVVDTRTVQEYRGAKRFGEARGGHLPRAVHLHFRELLHSSPTASDSRISRATGRWTTPWRPATSSTFCSNGPARSA